MRPEVAKAVEKSEYQENTRRRLGTDNGTVPNDLARRAVKDNQGNITTATNKTNGHARKHL